MSKVEHPEHYQGKIEVIDFIEAWDLNFHLGNVIKYICRSGKKEGSTAEEDLKKAAFYLNRYIEKTEGKEWAIQNDYFVYVKKERK